MKIPGKTLSKMTKIAGGTALVAGISAGAYYFGSDQQTRDMVCHTAEEAAGVVEEIGEGVGRAGRNARKLIREVVSPAKPIPPVPYFDNCPGCGMG